MTPRQKEIVILIDAFTEGYLDEVDIEMKLKKLFTNKRNKQIRRLR